MTRNKINYKLHIAMVAALFMLFFNSSVFAQKPVVKLGGFI